MIEESCKCKYSILPEIRQILLPWDYELTDKYFFNELTN